MSTWFASATLWDWAIGLVAVLSILMGLWRGFVRTAFGLAAWVLAFLFTAPVSALVAPWVAGFSMPTLVLQIIVFLVLFVLCRFVGGMVSRAMRACRRKGKVRSVSAPKASSLSTLFLSGCGRVFDGTLEQHFDSLGRLSTLPHDTQVYAAHDSALYF